ncbi:hypothetical protein [Pigmentiphaga kullae]|uniref:Uncharacterized protein n=1 Tax=Pigmentiphaga kullae TaxID=151784 RepID=A0A4Q7NCK0_9BURK|nr:hypothetical protein [Pigmentiphaga kullae]RZS80610.1 hypothetical protein EV675_3222 [Pigmentiphaga kullae]
MLIDGKICTMNCGPAAGDTRTETQRRAECDDCIAAAPTPPAATAAPSDDCDDVDAILRIVGLDPERCRTEGGMLNVGRVRTLWEDVVSLAAQASGQAARRAMNDSDLKYIQRVLESNAPDEDRERAAQMVRDIRRSYGQAPAVSAEPVALSQHDYQTLFNAIAAATWTTADGDIEISVQAFRDALKGAPVAAQAPQDESPADILPPPGIHTAVHYAGWLRREAHRHQEPKASVLRQAARMLDVLKAECGRLHQELIDSQAPAANGDALDAARLGRLLDAAHVAVELMDGVPDDPAMQQASVELSNAAAAVQRTTGSEK